VVDYWYLQLVGLLFHVFWKAYPVLIETAQPHPYILSIEAKKAKYNKDDLQIHKIKPFVGLSLYFVLWSQDIIAEKILHLTTVSKV
jgi:hypothetical protein